MDYDKDKVDDAVLALLYLTTMKDKCALGPRAAAGFGHSRPTLRRSI